MYIYINFISQSFICNVCPPKKHKMFSLVWLGFFQQGYLPFSIYLFLSEKPTLVDRGCSPHQFIGQCLNVGDITSDKLTDLCASEDGNRQLALLLIKNEVRNDGSYDRRVRVYSSPPPFLVLFFCFAYQFCGERQQSSQTEVICPGPH